jgi:hypothetical protein
MPAIPTFISFDADYDEALKNALNGQAKHPQSPFSIVNWSIQEPFKTDWQERVRARIKRARVMAVICGQHTNKATGVSVEIKIAREENIPYFLLWGYPDKQCVKPTAALPSDKIYKWTWDNLVSLLNGYR